MKLSITRIIDVDRYIPTSILGDIKTKYTDIEIYDFIDKYGKKSDSRSYPLGICCSVNKKGTEPIISVYTQVLVEIDNFLEVGSIIYLDDDGKLTTEKSTQNQVGVGVAVNYKSNKSEELTNCIYVSCSLHSATTQSTGGGSNSSSSEDVEYINKKIEDLKQEFKNFTSTVDGKISLKADKSTRLIAGQGIVINGSQDLSGDNEFISYGTGSGGGDGTIGTALIDFTDKSKDLFFIIKVEKGKDGYKEFMIQKIKDEDGFGSPNMMLHVRAITSVSNSKGAMYEIRYSNTYGENPLQGVQFYEDDESVSILVQGGYTYTLVITSTLSRNMTIRWGATFNYANGEVLSSSNFKPSKDNFWATRNRITTELVYTDSSNEGIVGDDSIPDTPSDFSVTSMTKGFFVNYKKPTQSFVKGINIYVREKYVGYWRKIFTSSTEIFVKGEPNTVYEVFLRSVSFLDKESEPTDTLEVLSKNLESSDVQYPVGGSPEELKEANESLNKQIEDAEKELSEGISGVTTEVNNLSKKITEVDLDTLKSTVSKHESEITQLPDKISSSVSEGITNFDENVASKKYSLIEQLPNQITIKVQSMHKEINEMIDGETVINRVNQIVVDEEGIKLSGHSINIGEGIKVDEYGKVALGTVTADKLVIGDNFYADADTGELRIKQLNAGLILGLNDTLGKIQDDIASANKTYTSQPVPPYRVGDMWFKDGDLYVCIQGKANGEEFALGDWQQGDNTVIDSVARAEAEEAKKKAEEAVNKANESMTTVEDATTDGTITPKEKQELYKELSEIRLEKTGIILEASKWSIDFTKYQSILTALENTLKPILSDMDTTSKRVNTSVLRDRFKDYYSEKQNILDEIQRKTENVSNEAQKEIDYIKDDNISWEEKVAKLEQEIKDLKDDKELITIDIGRIVSDLVVTPYEKQEIKREWEDISTEYPLIYARGQAVEPLVENTLLQFKNSYVGLSEFIFVYLNLFSDMGKVTHLKDRDLFNRFKNYYDYRERLLEEVQKALREETKEVSSRTDIITERLDKGDVVIGSNTSVVGDLRVYGDARFTTLNNMGEEVVITDGTVQYHRNGVPITVIRNFRKDSIFADGVGTEISFPDFKSGKVSVLTTPQSYTMPDEFKNISCHADYVDRETNTFKLFLYSSEDALRKYTTTSSTTSMPTTITESYISGISSDRYYVGKKRFTYTKTISSHYLECSSISITLDRTAFALSRPTLPSGHTWSSDDSTIRPSSNFGKYSISYKMYYTVKLKDSTGTTIVSKSSLTTGIPCQAFESSTPVSGQVIPNGANSKASQRSVIYLKNYSKMTYNVNLANCYIDSASLENKTIEIDFEFIQLGGLTTYSLYYPYGGYYWKTTAGLDVYTHVYYSGTTSNKLEALYKTKEDELFSRISANVTVGYKYSTEPYATNRVGSGMLVYEARED